MKTPPFVYCPKCGTKLIELTNRGSQDNRLAQCPQCSFEQYDNPKPCVAILIVKQNRICFGERAQEPKKGFWHLPGGFVDSWETVEATVRRELEHEAGVKVTRLQYMTSIPDVYGDTGIPTVNLCFVVEIDREPLPKDDEIAQFQWFDINTPPENIAFEHQRTLLAMYNRNLVSKL